MIILGIDPGTATTGWAVIEVDIKPKAIAYGHIQTSSKNKDVERLQEIIFDIRNICKKYKPQEAAIEKLFFFKNQKTIITVAQARGAILLTLANEGLSIAEYTPLQVKQSITGYGRAEKYQMQIMITSLFSLPEIPTPDDTADALAIALCHAHSRKNNPFK
ncbi:MAG: crossover junction endodeoxyribonuclease RuvC [Candidatus Moraniibacteriota bacterium]|nr:MAG: crossover junction endodeoxyribonuclease RuvC [Candidatus Moranbacteria bacterium]